MPSASATPWDGLPDSGLTPARALAARAHREACDAGHAPLGGEAALFSAYERDACPRRGSPDVVRDGRDARWVRRWLCRSCGRPFAPMTGTISEGHRTPASGWREFAIQPLSFDGLAEVARSSRRSPTAPPYWLAKPFLVLDGVRDGVVLSGRVQVDEAFCPVPAAGLERSADGRAKPGFSRNKLRVAAATDGAGRPVVIPCGRGKPGGGRALAAHGPHIERGPTLVRDTESAHDRLARELALVSEARDSRLLSRLPDRESPLRDVNRPHFLLKAFPDRRRGFDRGDPAGRPDLFSVIVNPPSGATAKAAAVLDRAMAFPETLRYRELYEEKRG